MRDISLKILFSLFFLLFFSVAGTPEVFASLDDVPSWDSSGLEGFDYSFESKPLGPVSNLPDWSGSVGSVEESESGDRFLRVSPEGFYSHNYTQVSYLYDEEVFDMADFDSFGFNFYHYNNDTSDADGSFFFNNGSYSSAYKEVHLKSDSHDSSVDSDSLLIVKSNNSSFIVEVYDTSGTRIDLITLDNDYLLDLTPDDDFGVYELFFRFRDDDTLVGYIQTSNEDNPSTFMLMDVDLQSAWEGADLGYISIGGQNRSYPFDIDSFFLNFREESSTSGFVDITDFSFSELTYLASIDDPEGGTSTAYGDARINVYDTSGTLIQSEDLPSFEYESGNGYLEEVSLPSLGFDFTSYNSGDYVLEVELIPYFQSSLTDSTDFTVGDYDDLVVNVEPDITGFDIDTNELSFDTTFSGVDSSTYPVEVFLNVDGQTRLVDSFDLDSDTSQSYVEDISEFLSYGSADSKVTVIVYSDDIPYSFNSDIYEVEHSGSFGGEFPELSDSFDVVSSGAMNILQPFKSTFLNFFDNLQNQFPFNFFYAGVSAFNTAYNDFQELDEPEYPKLVLDWDFAGQEYSINMFPFEKLMTEGDLYESDFNPATFFDVMRGIASASMLFAFILYIFKMIPARVARITNTSNE